MPIFTPRKFSVLTTAPLDNENGLVGRWCVDGTGTDWSGNSNNGSIVGGASPAQGIVGESLLFGGAGSNQYVTVPSNATLQPANITLTAWFKLNVIPSGPNYAAIISMPRSAAVWTAPYLSFILRINSATVIEYDLVSSSYVSATATVPTILVGTWHHVAVTYAGGVQTLYFDRVKVGSTSFTGPIGYTVGQPLMIGADNGATPVGEITNGYINDVRMYNRGLSGAEINAICDQALSYQQGSPEGEMPALYLYINPGALVGRAFARAGGSAAPTGMLTLQAAATGRGTATSNVSGKVPLAGRSFGQADGSGSTAPKLALALKAAGFARAGASSALSGIAALSAKATGHAQATSVGTFIAALRALGMAKATGQSAITGKVSLLARGMGGARGIAGTSGRVSLAGALRGIGSGRAGATFHAALSAFTRAMARGSASPSGRLALTGRAIGAAFSSAAISVFSPLISLSGAARGMARGWAVLKVVKSPQVIDQQAVTPPQVIDQQAED